MLCRLSARVLSRRLLDALRGCTAPTWRLLLGPLPMLGALDSGEGFSEGKTEAALEGWRLGGVAEYLQDCCGSMPFMAVVRGGEASLQAQRDSGGQFTEEPSCEGGHVALNPRADQQEKCHAESMISAGSIVTM